MIESIGRFHLLLLHLPIGVFVLVFLLEIITKFRKDSSHKEAITAGLLIGMCSAILSCMTGLMLSNGGDYEGDLISSHKYYAIGLTALSVVLYILNIRNKKEGASSFYGATFLLLMILLGITGHKGGAITHGEGFLTNSSSDQNEIIGDINEAVVYEEIIRPIIKTKCVSCHRSSKSKGELILTDSIGILKGGKNGPIIVHRSIGESVLTQRINLPLEEEEHMPPKGKKQLTVDEVSLLEWWIEEGASFDGKIKDLEKNEDLEKILNKYTKPKSTFDQLKIEPISEATVRSLTTAGISARIISDNSPLVEVNLAHNKLLDKTMLKKLKKVGEQITSLDLSFTNVDDNMLTVIKDLPHLRNLQLQGTSITSESIKSLRGLNFLKTLNIYKTKVDDEVFDVVSELQSLQSIYLWQSLVTQEIVDKLRLAKPLLNVVYNEGADIFGDANLRPPLILAKQDLFRDTLEVELNLSFKNVDFYYTVDGSEPDSSSTKYIEPFVIEKSSLVRAMSKKKGWIDSVVAERQFVQSKYEVKDIVLQGRPSEKYKGLGNKTLVDFVKGSEQFTDGNWLGYEGEHLIATLDLGAPETVESVTVSALDAPSSWIFYPAGVKIETSTDGVNFVEGKQIRYPLASSMESASLKNFTENFDSRKARYIKIKVESILKNPVWHPNQLPSVNCSLPFTKSTNVLFPKPLYFSEGLP